MLRSPASRRRLTGALALFLAAGPAAAAGTGEAPAVDACVQRYQSSLKGIEATEFGALKEALGHRAPGTAPGAGAEGDPLLPGVLLFNAQARTRSQAEISALTAAVALARSKGRSASVAGNDATWIGARLREDLGDYLGQKAAPFLCEGVSEYVKTLRGLAARLGPTADRRDEWIRTQRGVAERSVAAAIGAIEKAKAPPRSPPVSQSALRPAADLARGEAPAASAAEPVALLAPADLSRAVDRLVADARAAMLVSDPQGTPAIAGAVAAPVPIMNAVLARLAAAKPYVMSARPLIQERTVRLKVLAAFSDIEALDYLMESKAQTADPVASAVDGVLNAIERARAADCTCAR